MINFFKKHISLFIEGDIWTKILFLCGVIATSFIIGLIIVYIKEIILTIIITLFVIYIFKPTKNKNLSFQEQHRQAMHSIPPFIFKVLQENSLLKILGVDTPKTIEDILPINPIIKKNGFEFFCFKLLKISGEFSDDKLKTEKNVLQEEINKALFIGFPNLYTRFKDAPFVYIDELFEEDSYIVLHVALVDNDNIYHYLGRKRSILMQRKESAVTPKDSDF